MVIKKCKICGKEFDARGRDLTCSPECNKINKREYNKKYNKKWREENPEYMKEYNKKWREENKEYRREYEKQWYEDNKEYRREYEKQWYEDNKEHIRKHQKQWREKNKEYRREYEKKYRETRISELQNDIFKNGLINPKELEHKLKKINKLYHKRELEVIEYNQDYSQSYYKDFIIGVKNRANGYCELTGKKIDNGAVHHLYNFSNYMDLGADPDNGIYLDKEIHKQFHSEKGYDCTANDFIDFCRENGYEVPQLVFDLKNISNI